MILKANALAALAALLVVFPVAASADAPPNNIYGAHTFVQDLMAPSVVDKHLDWVYTLTGPGGYVKQLIYPIHPGTQAHQSWKYFVQACYDRDLIPVLRFALWAEEGSWVKPPEDAPGDYTTMANTFKNVVAQLPKDDELPMYIEVLNETNNNYEWSGTANPVEYGTFLVQVSNALRSLGDDRVKVMNGGLSPGGSYDNLAYIDVMCREVPGFINSFDAWATHPYTSLPPEINFHDGTASPGSYPIDSYMRELAVLASHGRTGVQIIATEGGYMGMSEDRRADLMMRAFRDYYTKWPEVLGICPWEFSNPLSDDPGVDWVDKDSTGVYPSQSYRIYDLVYKLAKVWMDTGTITGKVTETQFDTPLAGVQVTLQPGGKVETTDTEGNFMFERLTPGAYQLQVERSGYAASGAAVTVAEAENELANFSLAATSAATISGTVRDSISNIGIGGVQIVANPGNYTASTGPDGKYVLPALPPSTYTISASAPGYYSFVTPGAPAAPGEAQVRNFWLGPGGPPPGQSIIGAAEFESPVGGGPASGWVPQDGQPHPEILQVDPSFRYNGVSSQRIQPTADSINLVWQMSDYGAIVSGRSYRVEAWVRAAAPVGAVRVKCNFFSNDTVFASTFTCQPVLSTSSGWTRVVGQAVAPPFPSTGNRGRLQVELIADMSGGVAWFDSVWAGEVSGAAPPASPTAFYALPLPQSGSIALQWRHGVSPSTAGTRIVYRTDRYPLHPTDGTLLVNQPGSPDSQQSPVSHAVQFGTRYYYAAFTYGPGESNMSRPVHATSLITDTTPPTAPGAVSDGGRFTATADPLTASWAPASDGQSGIADYQVRIGTAPGQGDLLDWTSTAGQTSFVRSDLDLQAGQTYFITVRAINGAGLQGPSASSDGIVAAVEAQSIGAAKLLTDGTAVIVHGLAAIKSGILDGVIYISAEDRSSGIRVESAELPAVAVGDHVRAAGFLQTSGAERAIGAAEVTVTGSEGPLVPLALTNRQLGGGGFHYNPGPPASGQRGTSGSGLNNVGLLVTTWGRVEGTDGAYLLLSDGSEQPVRVDTSHLTQTPQPGDYVTYTGISTLRLEGDVPVAVLMPRGDEDQAVL